MVAVAPPATAPLDTDGGAAATVDEEDKEYCSPREPGPSPQTPSSSDEEHKRHGRRRPERFSRRQMWDDSPAAS